MEMWELSWTALLKWLVVWMCFWSVLYAGFHVMGNWVDSCPRFLYNWAWRSAMIKEREANRILDLPYLPLMYRQEAMLLTHLLGGIPLLAVFTMSLGTWWGGAFLGALIIDILSTAMIIHAVGKHVEQIRRLRLSS